MNEMRPLHGVGGHVDGAAANVCVQVSPFKCVFTPLRCVPGCRLTGSHGAGAGGLLAQSCLTLRPRGQQPTRLLSPQDCPGKDAGEGCHLLLQGMFPTQGPRLLCWQVGSFPLSRVGSPGPVALSVQLSEELLSTEEAPFSAPAAAGLGFSVLTETAFAISAARRMQ